MLMWARCLGVGLFFAVVACSPPTTQCGTRVCGIDRTGESCGHCDPGEDCTLDGVCAAHALCSLSNPTGSCSPGSRCVDGVCTVNTLGPCSPSEPTGTCPAPQICQFGACMMPGPQCGTRVCGSNGAGGSCGACPAGQNCTSDGACMTPGPDACSAAHPAGTCATGQTCVAGSCCDATSACGAVCCSAGSICVQDASGNRACAQRCDVTPECPGVAGVRCCRTLFDATTHAPLSYGACGTFMAGGECRCAHGTDCGSGTCTPRLDPSGNPQRPYICVASGTCTPYGTCDGLGSCPNGYCNLCDAANNCFCARVCANDTMCGAAQCVAFPRSIGACSNGQPACGAR